MRGVWLALAVGLAGCAGATGGGAGGEASAVATTAVARDPVPPALRVLLEAPPGVDFVLLGEVHDHPEHHRRRLDWLETLAAGGRFALALEQLDADRQPAIDAARNARADARQVAAAGGFDATGWPWTTYAPYVELALRRGLPLVAANLSAAQARRLARAEPGAPAPVEPSGWSDVDRRTMRDEIRDGHCGLLPERAIAPMASAQLARDARMAQALREARERTGLPVVLIAGNGHVRRDVGVPRHLEAAMPGARVLTVGMLESAAGRLPPAESARYDLAVPTPVHPRPDPCEQLRGIGARK